MDVRGEVKALRDDADNMPGQLAAQRRLVLHSRLLFGAFNSLDLFSAADAEDYLGPALVAICGKDNTKGQEQVLMLVLMFALVAVEADRER